MSPALQADFYPLSYWEAWECKCLPQSLILLLDFTFCDYSLTPSTAPGVIQEIEADGEGLAALGEATARPLLGQGTLDLSLRHHDWSQRNRNCLICERNVVPTASVVLPVTNVTEIHRLDSWFVDSKWLVLLFVSSNMY